MSINLRISDKPYVAEIRFKDGTYRQIDYANFTVSSGFFQFLSDDKGEGPMVFVNVDIIASVDCDSALRPVGGMQ